MANKVLLDLGVANFALNVLNHISSKEKEQRDNQEKMWNSVISSFTDAIKAAQEPKEEQATL